MQDAVNHLTDENEGLATERQVLLESLCAQTEKLENARMQIDHLKVLNSFYKCRIFILFEVEQVLESLSVSVTATPLHISGFVGERK